MNKKNTLVNNVLKFLENKEKSVLIIGTDRYEKHTTIITILDKYYSKFYLEQILGRIYMMKHYLSNFAIILLK